MEEVKIEVQKISKMWTGTYADGVKFTLETRSTHSTQESDMQHMLSFEYRETYPTMTKVTAGRWQESPEYTELVEQRKEPYSYSMTSYDEMPDAENGMLFMENEKRWTTRSPLACVRPEFINHMHTYHDVSISEGEIRGRHSQWVD